MEGDIAGIGQYIGAGLACFALMGAALSIGNIFSSFMQGAFRNPTVANQMRTNLFVGAGLAEAAGILGFVVAIMLVMN